MSPRTPKAAAAAPAGVGRAKAALSVEEEVAVPVADVLSVAEPVTWLVRVVDSVAVAEPAELVKVV